MRTSVPGTVIDPRGVAADRPIRAGWPARLVARFARTLWLRDRPVAELRWAAVTLTAMAALAVVGKLLGHLGPDFDVAILLTVPLAILALVAGWSRYAAALMAKPFARLLIGPFVVLVGMAATGPIDLVSLDVPPSAPLAWLALAFAAITPGFPIAFALLAGTTLGALVGHELVTAGGATGEVHDAFVVRAAVMLFATIGMYLVVRVATEAEGRASRLADRARARVDALESLERITRRYDGSRPVRDVSQAVVEDVAREFDIPLVSMYLFDDQGRLSMVGVEGYHSPFHVIDIGVGVIGRSAAAQETQYIPDVLADPDYRAARDDVRSEVAAPIVHHGELLGIVNFEGTLAQPIRTGHIAVADMLARTIAASLRAAQLDEERRDRLQAIDLVLDASNRLAGHRDIERVARNVVDLATDLLAADAVTLMRRAPDGTVTAQATPAVESGAVESGAVGAVGAMGPDHAVVVEALQTGAPVVHAGERPVLAVPVRVDGDLAGALAAIRPAGAPAFSPMDLRMTEILVAQVEAALRAPAAGS